MKIIDFFSNNDIATLLGKYISIDNKEELFEKSIQDLHSTECILPVLGVQGTGKSSFLNALLFGDIVLPVDAVETTCIPTIVRYGNNDKPVANVVFADGSKKEIECTEPGLGEYVHQDKNPGNRMGVSHIEIVWNNDLLANGITLVDLPGVGSITEANQKTTLDFLKKSTGAIFMLRTTPTITKSEATFIQGALPLMGHVFWVQNQWTDDAPNDLKESKEENFATLKKIAIKIRQPEEVINEPEVVCVKHALDGRILHNQEMIDKSGISQFRDKIIAFKSNWQQAILKGKLAQAREMVDNALISAEEKISRLTGDIEIELAKIRQQKKLADDTLEQNRNIAKEARKYLFDQRSLLSDFVSKQCTVFAENLRNDVREVIDSGVVGGEHLNSAFKDHLTERSGELFEQIQPEFLKITEELAKSLNGLAECKLAGRNINVSTSFSEKTKVHNFYGRGATVTGSVLGGWGAAAGVAAIKGVALTAFMSTPAGWITAAAGAIVLGLFGMWGGNKAKKVHVESQQDAAKRELFRYISDVQTEAKKTYTESYNTFCAEVEKSIFSWLMNQENSIEDEYAKAKQDLSKPAETKEVEKASVEQDIVFLKNLKESLEA